MTVAVSLPAVACLMFLAGVMFAAGVTWEACRRHGSLDLRDEANRLSRYLGHAARREAGLRQELADARVALALAGREPLHRWGVRRG